MKSGVSILTDNLQKVQRSIAALTQTNVLVGIPSERAERDDDEGEAEPINNAGIGYIMENGAPEMNIPRRPFLVPGVKNAQPQITSIFRQATVDALVGDVSGFTRAMNEAGLIASSAVQQKIDDGPFEPLSDRTLRERARKQLVSGGTKKDRRLAAQALATKDYSLINAKPLIDTVQLLRSITYVIRKR